MLITTGKAPDAVSRAIARALWLAVPESRLEFRGKRSLSSLVSLARKKHQTRICSVYLAHGKPSSLSFLSVGDDGSWARLSPSIAVKKVVFSGTTRAGVEAKDGQSQRVAITGAKAKPLSRLLSPANPQDRETGSRIIAGARTLSIFVGKKRMLSLGVAYEKEK